MINLLPSESDSSVLVSQGPSFFPSVLGGSGWVGNQVGEQEDCLILCPNSLWFKKA